VLGVLSNAQAGVSGGLSPERQAKLLEQFARALDSRDPKTYGHSRRVARYSWMIATRMNLGREQVARIRTAAAIHDIGKIETPDSILNKAGSLTDEEYETIKLHSRAGADMSVALHDEELTSFVLHHHERLDGTGYPEALSGDAIPIGSRIIAVADTFDALTANRSYRTARTHQQALAVLTEDAGTRLDPVAVKAFCAHYSGRRGLTVWGGLSSLPERAFEFISTAATGVGAVAKTMAVAALAGGLATTTATLAHPASQERTVSKSAQASVATVSQSGGGSTGRKAQRAGGGSRQTADVAGTRPAATVGIVGATPTTVAESAPETVATDRGSAPSSGSGPSGQSTVVTESPTPGHTNDGGEKTPTTTAKSPSSSPTPTSTTGHERPSSGPASGVVGHTGEKVEEVTKGTVEEVKGKVQEVKGKVEEVAKGTVEETKSKVEETKGKVEEVAKGKVEEVKGVVEETGGKLKKITGLTTH
jgi:HD domain